MGERTKRGEATAAGIRKRRTLDRQAESAAKAAILESVKRDARAEGHAAGYREGLEAAAGLCGKRAVDTSCSHSTEYLQGRSAEASELEDAIRALLAQSPPAQVRPGVEPPVAAVDGSDTTSRPAEGAESRALSSGRCGCYPRGSAPTDCKGSVDDEGCGCLCHESAHAAAQAKDEAQICMGCGERWACRDAVPPAHSSTCPRALNPDYKHRDSCPCGACAPTPEPAPAPDRACPICGELEVPVVGSAMDRAQERAARAMAERIVGRLQERGWMAAAVYIAHEFLPAEETER